MVDAPRRRVELLYPRRRIPAASGHAAATPDVGIGITITQDEDTGAFPIVTVTDGGPAASAGLQAGDVITAINGQDVTALSMSELRSLVRGEEGTTLSLTYRRGDTESTCTLTRGNIETEVVHAQLLDGGIGYVRIVNFDGGCAEKTIAAIEDLQAQGATSILFDVRNNPGGLKSELVDLLDYLLPEGEYSSRTPSTTREMTRFDTSDEAHLALPMAVLVNRESYSAAEFFAAALQEYEAAVIVGTQTYGKGYFQSALQLSDGSAINLSIGKYFTPQGKSLGGRRHHAGSRDLPEVTTKRLALPPEPWRFPTIPGVWGQFPPWTRKRLDTAGSHLL